MKLANEQEFQSCDTSDQHKPLLEGKVYDSILHI